MKTKHTRALKRRHKSLTLQRRTITIITLPDGPKPTKALVHGYLAIAKYAGLYHVTHIPTGRSIVAAKSQKDARKTLEALHATPIDFDFDAYAVSGTPGKLKYDLSEAHVRHTVALLMQKGVKLIDPMDAT